MSPCQKNKMKGKEKNKTEWGNSLILSRKSLIFKIRLKLSYFFFIYSFATPFHFYAISLGLSVDAGIKTDTINSGMGFEEPSFYKRFGGKLSSFSADICLPLPSHRQPRNGTPFWGPLLLENLATLLHPRPCVAYTVISR